MILQCQIIGTGIEPFIDTLNMWKCLKKNLKSICTEGSSYTVSHSAGLTLRYSLKEICKYVAVFFNIPF